MKRGRGLRVRSPPPPPPHPHTHTFGGPPKFIKRGKTSWVGARMERILVVNRRPHNSKIPAYMQYHLSDTLITIVLNPDLNSVISSACYLPGGAAKLGQYACAVTV